MKPWKQPAWERADISAIKALENGNANPEQQQRFLKCLIESICDTYGQTYVPESARDTDFAQGRRWVGLALINMLKVRNKEIKC